MSENIQCPFGDSCPTVLSNQSKIDLLAQKIELQNQFTNEKLQEVCDDLKEAKDFFKDGLVKMIDSRIDAKLNEQKAGILKWVISTAISSGALGSILTMLFGK